MDYFITLNEKSIDAIGEAVEKPITVIEGLKETLAETIQEKDAIIAQKDEIIADKDEEIEGLEKQIAEGPEYVTVFFTKDTNINVLTPNIAIDNTTKRMAYIGITEQTTGNVSFRIPKVLSKNYKVRFKTSVRAWVNCLGTRTASSIPSGTIQYCDAEFVIPKDTVLTDGQTIGSITTLI